MVKKMTILVCAGALSCSAADSLLKPVNDLQYGTWAARVQALSMYRDYENYNLGPDNAYSTTLGFQLGYESPELAGLSFGGVYSYAEPLDASEDSSNGHKLVANGRINLLNEGWAKYRMESLGLTNTWAKAGRQVINGEVFRADEYRQKPRSLEAATLTTKDVPDTSLTVGQAWRLSNWIDDAEKWKFHEFGKDVFGAGYNYDTHGVTWAEGEYKGITNLQVAAYNAYAYDVANVAGGRAKYAFTDTTAINGYYRHENDVGRALNRDADMLATSLEQKVGSVTLEPGIFSVIGDDLVFEEATTGINHPLGSSMMMYSGQFKGDSDTYYLKATTKIGKTGLYTLYNYTVHDEIPYDGQELNFMVKQPIGDRLVLAFKVGAGYRERDDNQDDTFASDVRASVTYTF